MTANRTTSPRASVPAAAAAPPRRTTRSRKILAANDTAAAALETEIDTLIYKPYGLNANEIFIVEGKK